ncbi:RDD family protein [Rhodoferax sp. 4810]|uniref:RDD family protein n=1 Tax=Thiospirillum jenense TaxID=1653858 RepID=A0A839HE94_9GAMM|nr:RDD family protein [Thiospirillum jenense]MBB1073354.1 RDD family protein [Rhodoferax jenense]MBB1125706.1 RDD family protein [Thiospirillum jenense]
MSQITTDSIPSGLRRLFCAGYDVLLLASLLFIATAIILIPYQSLTGNNLTSGVGRLTLQIYLLLIIVGYYLYFWSHGRQTLGMRAWRIQFVNQHGYHLTWSLAAWRLLWSLITLAPIALLWSSISRSQYAWHDQLSRTYPILVAK